MSPFMCVYISLEHRHADTHKLKPSNADDIFTRATTALYLPWERNLSVYLFDISSFGGFLFESGAHFARIYLLKRAAPVLYSLVISGRRLTNKLRYFVLTVWHKRGVSFRPLAASSKFTVKILRFIFYYNTYFYFSVSR